MGKWEPTERQGYHDVYRMTEGKIDWLTNNTGFDKDQATRYAIALNIVDAGVDLGEAVRLLELLDKCEQIENIDLEIMQVALDVDFANELREHLQRIANAVEGDKTKEEV